MKTDETRSSRPTLYTIWGTAMNLGVFGGKTKSVIMSYLNLRRLIGWLGIFLPVICVLGGRVFAGLACQSSISFYYHTNMRDFFIGMLLAVSIFLITYKGYHRIDSIVTWVIGLAGIVVALFPTAGPVDSPDYAGLFQVRAGLADAVHLIAAGIFFFLLALNSLFLFTLSKDEKAPVGSNKPLRNLIYVACGVIILVCLAMFLILKKAMGPANFLQGPTVLILESVMLLAFGVSWLVKGEAILGDAGDKAKPTQVKK